jgi:hypothetical protein
MRSVGRGACWLAGALLLGCSSTNRADTGADGGTSSPDSGTLTLPDGGAIVQKELACLAVLQCAVDCPETGAACRDACLARGTDDGQAKALALATCLNENNCQDSNCLDANCAPEYDACLTVPPPTGGKPIAGPAPPGSVPAEWVGTWKHTTYTGADNFTFNADGTAQRKQVETSAFSGCSNTVAFEDSGTAVFTAARDGFTFYITKSTQTSSACGQASTAPGTTGAFDFTLEAIPALGPGHYWFFRVQDCPVTAEIDKRIQCGGEYDL